MSDEARIQAQAAVPEGWKKRFGGPGQLFWINPIVVKEIRAQMRGPRAFWILTGYLTALGLLTYGLYRVTMFFASQRYGGMASPMQSAYIGQALFIGLAFLELLCICFISPALTAGAISGEYERGTYDMLLATPLRSAAILWGKLIPSLTYVMLLIVAAVPLFSVVYLFGGVVVRDMIQAIGLMAVTGLAFGSLGVFFSALTRRTGRATVFTYLVVLVLTFGTMFGWVTMLAIWGNTNLPPFLLCLNPLSALGSAIMTPEVAGDYYSNPFLGILSLISGGMQSLGMNSPTPWARPLWQYTIVIYLTATVLLQGVTIQLVKPMRRWRLRRRDAVITLLVLLAIAGMLYLVFGTTRGSTGWVGDGTPTPVPVMPMLAPAIPVNGPVMIQTIQEDFPPTPTPLETPTATPTGTLLPTPTLPPMPTATPAG